MRPWRVRLTRIYLPIGEGVAEPLAGAAAVVDVANSPKSEDKAA